MEAEPVTADQAPVGRPPVYLHRNLAIGTVIVVAAVVLVPVAVPQLGYGVVSHLVCGQGAVVASEYFWTPIALLNSPYRGVAWVNQTTHYGTGFITEGTNATNGTSVGIFDLDEWNLTRAVNSSSAGPGLSHPCVQRFLASHNSPDVVTVLRLNHSSNESDFNEVQNFSLMVYGFGPPIYNEVARSVNFNNSYWGDNDGGYGACDAGGPSFNFASSSDLPVTVPFTYEGRSVPMAITLESQVAYSYEFPAGENFNFFDPMDASPPYGGGLAFDATNCTMTLPP